MSSLDSRYRGYYRRPRTVQEYVEAGEINLLDLGVNDFLCLNAQCQLRPGGAIPPGVWVGSAAKINNLTGREHGERQIRRSLKRLEMAGLAKTFYRRGQRGDYPILVSGLLVRDESGNDFVVNARRTTNWRNPALEPYIQTRRDTFVKRPPPVHDVSGSLQEVEHEQGEKRAQRQHFAFHGTHLRVAENQDKLLGEAFPFVDRPQEYRKMDAWLEANPNRHLKNHARFTHNWFSRITLQPEDRSGSGQGGTSQEAGNGKRKFDKTVIV